MVQVERLVYRFEGRECPLMMSIEPIEIIHRKKKKEKGKGIEYIPSELWSHCLPMEECGSGSAGELVV